MKLAAKAHDKVLALLRDGINAQLEAIGARDGVMLAPVRDEAFIGANYGPALENEDVPVYPVVLVYVAESIDQQREKFAAFSGDHRVVVEIRVSTPGTAVELQRTLYRYAEAVMEVLKGRVNWNAEGLTWGGRYSVAYGQIFEDDEALAQVAHISLAISQLAGF